MGDLRESKAVTPAEVEHMEAIRRRLWREQRGRCAHCGGLLNLRRIETGGAAQLAHRLPQDKVMLRKYGKDIIHHPLNLGLVCSDYCNARVSKRNHPEWEQEHVAKIREAIEADRGEI